MAQQSLTQAFQAGTRKNEQEIFSAELCKALLSANIPLHKLQNPVFKFFLEKKLSFQRTGRKHYAQTLCK